MVGAPLCWRAFFAQRFAGEGEAVMVLHQAIEHGIGHSLVTYPLVPVLNWQLAGDDGGALAGAVKVVAAKSSMLKRLVFVFDSDPLVFAG